MNNLPYIIGALVILAVMEGIAWFVLRTPSVPEFEAVPATEEKVSQVQPEKQEQSEPLQVSLEEKKPEATSDSGSFPSPTTEVVDGVTERTIHIGVRQWEWNPNVIRAKAGERVRLIIHNADVRHTLVIPDLGIDVDIPPDGAVADFMVTKKGSFDFLCGTYCGVGHAEMQGTLVVE